MADPIKDITIVGGGTAGWMTAIMLQNRLALGANDGQRPQITLIESPNIKTIGVGEATVPSMPILLRELGVSEPEFIKTCNATFKLSVQFKNWNVDHQGKPIDFLNPFGGYTKIDDVTISEYFAKFGAGKLNFTQVAGANMDLIEAGKAPRPLGNMEIGENVGFAYHLDAGRFAAMLRDISISKGVKHICEDVLSVELDDRGFVAALQLSEIGRHEIELVIDCTGFRGFIINGTLNEPFLDYSKYLANDRAVAAQFPYPSDDRISPVTTSTALSSGWAWRVPLFNRIGAGYVFSSAHITDAQAQDEFLQNVGMSPTVSEPRIIPLRIGRLRNSWVKNCVAIGLSGGFIEPLESTAIHMIDKSVRWLCRNFPTLDFPDPYRKQFNKLTNSMYSEMLDFVCLHYALGNRTDSQYWIDTRQETTTPDRLGALLELWKYRLPEHDDLEFQSLFTEATYSTILLGKQVYSQGFGADTFKTLGHMDERLWQRYIIAARRDIDAIVAKNADHRLLLREMRGELKSLGNLSGLGI